MGLLVTVFAQGSHGCGLAYAAAPCIREPRDGRRGCSLHKEAERGVAAPVRFFFEKTERLPATRRFWLSNAAMCVIMVSTHKKGREYERRVFFL